MWDIVTLDVSYNRVRWSKEWRWEATSGCTKESFHRCDGTKDYLWLDKDQGLHLSICSSEYDALPSSSSSLCSKNPLTATWSAFPFVSISFSDKKQIAIMKEQTVFMINTLMDVTGRTVRWVTYVLTTTDLFLSLLDKVLVCTFFGILRPRVLLCGTWCRCSIRL